MVIPLRRGTNGGASGTTIARHARFPRDAATLFHVEPAESPARASTKCPSWEPRVQSGELTADNPSRRSSPLHDQLAKTCLPRPFRREFRDPAARRCAHEQYAPDTQERAGNFAGYVERSERPGRHHVIILTMFGVVSEDLRSTLEDRDALAHLELNHRRAKPPGAGLGPLHQGSRREPAGLYQHQSRDAAARAEVDQTAFGHVSAKRSDRIQRAKGVLDMAGHWTRAEKAPALSLCEDVLQGTQSSVRGGNDHPTARVLAL